jgi:hypothetical protein
VIGFTGLEMDIFTQGNTFSVKRCQGEKWRLEMGFDPKAGQRGSDARRPENTEVKKI